MKRLIVIRGGGELATACAIYLHNSGFRVLMLEKAQPASTRREISFADAIYDRKKTVARVTCRREDSLKEAEKRLKDGEIVMMIDPKGKNIPHFKPKVVLDAIMAHETKSSRLSRITSLEVPSGTINVVSCKKPAEYFSQDTER